MTEEIVFCKGGGCTAKLGPDLLSHVLGKIPRGEKDPDLLIGYDSRDDAAVYQITEDTAIVQTLDFFPPMLEDPYLFGQIAAANALSDIYAMGGTVKTALNILCFPEKMDLNILGKIMQGGAEKVIEAGGTLAGGHSIADADVKYGLSVMGIVNPKQIYANDKGRPSDVLIFTKKLGVGLVCNANRVGQAPKGAMEEAVASMTMLNKKAAKISHRYEIHACTDVTGFGFLGHLSEMINDAISAEIDSISIPVIKGAMHCAEEFLLTAAAQRNRNHVAERVTFSKYIPFAMEELLFDPQTSGGLLFAVKKEEAANVLAPYILIVQLIFSGILFAMEGMADYISYVMISRWGMEALGSIANLNDLPLKIQMTVPTVPHEFESRFDSTPEHLLTVWAVLFGFIVVFLLVGNILLHRVSKDTKG